MTKMDAVGVLCRIKEDKSRHLEWVLKKIADETACGSPADPYEHENIAAYKQEIRALEMAGAAMTK